MQKPLILNNQETDYVIYDTGIIYSNKTHKELTGSIYNTGYRMVRLSVEGSKKGYAIHRLVAEHFLDNPQNLPIVNHKDGNKLNNNVQNLEWVSQSENRKHALNQIKVKKAYGKRQKETIVADNIFWKQYKDTNYLVSKTGQLYNTKTGILLKQTPNASGYIRYILRINNQNKSKLAHVLVMETWNDLDMIPSGMIVNHKDGNKSNNDIDNLEIISKSENALHSSQVLKNNVKAVYSVDNSTNQREEYQSITQAAKKFNITVGAISYALKNRTNCVNKKWFYK